eukprot:Selendium_serpulae@DN6376_c0_g1_i18.p1
MQRLRFYTSILQPNLLRHGSTDVPSVRVRPTEIPGFKTCFSTVATAPPQLGVIQTTHSNGLLNFHLNRPKSLNVLGLEQVTFLGKALKELRHTTSGAILVTGEGAKAFCAGGDIIPLTKGDSVYNKTFFSSEYFMDYQTSLMDIPYISLWTGYVMGGGVGLSIHGRYRVATDKSAFSMPETAIGLFPDVGASYFLPKLGSLGLYLGLTGARMNGADLLNSGLATHFIPSDNVNAFKKRLAEAPLRDNPNIVADILSEFHDQSCAGMRPNIAETDRSKIDQYFGDVTSIADLVKGLNNARDDDFASSTAHTLSQMCPLSCGVWVRQFEKGKGMTLVDCLRMEFILAQAFTTKDPNFAEGVRAKLVAKSNDPRWEPGNFEELTGEAVEQMFNAKGLETLDDYVDLK